MLRNNKLAASALLVVLVVLCLSISVNCGENRDGISTIDLVAKMQHDSSAIGLLPFVQFFYKSYRAELNKVLKEQLTAAITQGIKNIHCDKNTWTGACINWVVDSANYFADPKVDVELHPDLKLDLTDTMIKKGKDVAMTRVKIKASNVIQITLTLASFPVSIDLTFINLDVMLNMVPSTGQVFVGLASQVDPAKDLKFVLHLGQTAHYLLQPIEQFANNKIPAMIADILKPAVNKLDYYQIVLPPIFTATVADVLANPVDFNEAMHSLYNEAMAAIFNSNSQGQKEPDSDIGNANANANANPKSHGYSLLALVDFVYHHYLPQIGPLIHQHTKDDLTGIARFFGKALKFQMLPAIIDMLEFTSQETEFGGRVGINLSIKGTEGALQKISMKFGPTIFINGIKAHVVLTLLSNEKTIRMQFEGQPLFDISVRSHLPIKSFVRNQITKAIAKTLKSVVIEKPKQQQAPVDVPKKQKASGKQKAPVKQLQKEDSHINLQVLPDPEKQDEKAFWAIPLPSLINKDGKKVPAH